MSFEDLPVIPRPEQWRNLDGVVLLDKPVGLTSNQALQWSRRLFAANKGGHTGTLDPFATGVLPLCLGEATKFSADLLNADKTYLATIKFGTTTTTGDAEGEVIATHAVDISREQLEAACKAFIGEISQVPPMYSALKFEGKSLYAYAREGVEIERQARIVHINSIQIESFKDDVAQITVGCSKGPIFEPWLKTSPTRWVPVPI